MKTKRTVYIAACSILVAIAAIFVWPPVCENQASSRSDSPSSLKEKPLAATVPSTSPPPQAPEVTASGAYRGSLKRSPETLALSREEAQAKLQKALQVENDGPNRFRIGTVKFDSARRTVTVPATVNMETGAIEYALVTETGKVHEALFATAAQPEQIHLACLLLGMPPEKKGETADPAAKAVKVKVMWDTNGPPAEHDLSQLVVTADDPVTLSHAQPLPIGPWTYVGSRIDGEGFAATREGSIISLITDPMALLDDPRETAKRDEHLFPNKALVPPKGSSVRIVLTIPGPAKKN
jgi:hypothetical protein